VDVGLIVAEPTLSGIHDLKRALQLLNHFHITPLVCINMHDINRKNTGRVVKFCEKNRVEVVGKIPFNPIVTDAMVDGKPILEYAPRSDVAQEIERIWNKILSVLR
jgi:MinD superfamily P-loop ATPase